MKIGNKRGYLETALMSLTVVLCALLPILIATGGKLYLVGDYMTQQLPFMKECRRVILSGTPFWSANTFLGANFVGTYSFYVYGSPFFWPLLLIPEGYMGIGLAVMFVIKHIVAALTARLYISRHTDNRILATVGALLYAFSGFTLDASYYYHFLDVVAFFPLVLYYADCVLDNKRKPMLSIVAFISAITNYYFLISTSIIFLIYLIVRVKYSKGQYKVRDIIRATVSYALGCIAAAVILIPSALCLLETSKATGSWANVLTSCLATVPQWIKFLEGTVLPSEGVLYSGTGFNFSSFTSTSAFLPMFGAFFVFIAILRAKKGKLWQNKMLKFLFILTFIPFGNGLFSLFTNMVYTRWWYALVLFSALATVKLIESDEKITETETKKSRNAVIIIGSAVTLIPLLIKILSAYVIKDFILNNLPKSIAEYLVSWGLTSPITKDEIRYLAVLIFLTAVSYGTLAFAVKKDILCSKRVLPLLVAVCIATYSVYLVNETVSYNKINMSAYTENEDTAINEKTEYSYRVNNAKILGNYSMISNEPGISTFNSFKSYATSDFSRIVGYKIRSAPLTDKYFTSDYINTVLSVKETVNADGTRTENRNYCPFGYCYGYYIEDDCEFTENTDINNNRIENMVKACYLDSETASKLEGIVTPLPDGVSTEEAYQKNLSSSFSDFCLTTKGFTAKSSGNSDRLIYISIPHDSGWTAYLNGKETEIYTLNGGMMGIVVEKGDAEIEFKFVPPGLMAGAIISILASLSVIIYGVTEYIRKKKKSD